MFLASILAWGKGTWVNFCWVCAAGLSEPLTHYSLFCGLIIIIDPILVSFGQISNFCDPNLVTFYLFIYLILNEEHFPFHLQYKHSCMFCKYKELSYPKNQKMCNPILVTLLKLLPHQSQSSPENSTPSSSTSPLASYEEVPPPPTTMGDTGVMPVSYRSVLSSVPSNSSRSLCKSYLTPVSEVIKPHFLLAILLSMSALHLKELTTNSQGFRHFFV